jgi:hypothetical protein
VLESDFPVWEAAGLGEAGDLEFKRHGDILLRRGPAATGGTLRRVTKPFRFGVVPRAAQSGSEWRAIAQRVEHLGYSTLLVPDHLTAQLSPWTALHGQQAVLTG